VFPSILLVEDNRGDALLVREALIEHEVNAELTLITDGERAIQFIAQLQNSDDPCPHLAIVDLKLPRRPGAEVLKALRQSEKCRTVHVIMLSSSNAQEDRDEASRLGATQYICKPSHLDEFMNLGKVFRNVLDGVKQHPHKPSPPKAPPII
jgi:CheY-like chemotaxis protein